MIHFNDINGSKVTFVYKENGFGREPDHVLVICKYNGNWVLTDHRIRGWEFPGGKREAGETLEQAAIREVFEETGGTLTSLQFIGEYEVNGLQSSFIKRIYLAEINEFIEKNDYLETNGPVLVSDDILTERFKANYSFIMKDEVVKLSLQRIETAGNNAGRFA